MPTTPDTTTGSVIALDVGDKRVGVARASVVARLPEPMVTLNQGPDFFAKLQNIITETDASIIVVGLPRNLNGEETPQTAATKAFITELRQHVDLPVHLQDEALTSRKAEKELEARGRTYQRQDIDALAATYILEDFLADHPDILRGVS